jgi:regulator of ribonuclease activity A
MDFKVADLCDEFGEEAKVFKPIFTDFGGLRKCCGEAVTVKCFEDNSKIKELSQQPGLGRVLVIDAGGSDRCALVGDMIAADLCANGWSGVIIYGCIRDSAELATLPIMIKAIGAMPRRSTRRGEGQIAVPVEFANQRINNGDKIYADHDGIIILNSAIE